MADSPVSSTATGVAIAVWVVPGSSRSAIDGRHGDRVKVRVAAPPEDGRANQEVAGLLRDAIGHDVVLEKGMRRRAKMFEVSGTNVGHVRRKLGV